MAEELPKGARRAAADYAEAHARRATFDAALDVAASYDAVFKAAMDAPLAVRAAAFGHDDAAIADAAAADAAIHAEAAAAGGVAFDAAYAAVYAAGRKAYDKCSNTADAVEAARRMTRQWKPK